MDSGFSMQKAKRESSGLAFFSCTQCWNEVSLVCCLELPLMNMSWIFCYLVACLGFLSV